MGMFARRKGRAGEQELAALLRESLGDLGTFERNSLQSRMGGKDLLTNLPYAFEIKRTEKPSFTAWVAQAEEQAAPNEIPVVAWRPSRAPWKFLLVLNGATLCHVVRAICWYHKSGRYQLDRDRGLLQGPASTKQLTSEGTNAAE